MPTLLTYPRQDSRTRAHHPVARTAATLLGWAVLLWAALCGLGLLLTGPLQHTRFEHADGATDRWLAGHRTPAATTITHWLTFGAETVTVAAVGLVFFVVLRLRLRRWRESIFLVVAVLGEVLIFVATTLMIDRARPHVAHLDPAPPTSSFPSGHTAAAVTLYGALAIIALTTSTLAWLRRTAVTLAVLVPLCVAFSRLYRGMHYPSDVLAGAALAAAWLWITSSVLLRATPRKLR